VDVNGNTIIELLDGGTVSRAGPRNLTMIRCDNVKPVETVSCTQSPNGLGLAQGVVDFQHSEKAYRAGRRGILYYCYVRNWWCLGARTGGASISESCTTGT
jgi:hypothetical protein